MQNTLNDLAESVSAIGTEEFFAQIDTNLNGVITWDEMIPWVQQLCVAPDGFDISIFQPLEEE